MARRKPYAPASIALPDPLTNPIYTQAEKNIIILVLLTYKMGRKYVFTALLVLLLNYYVFILFYIIKSVFVIVKQP